MVKQAAGCLASAWARLAARVGEVEATRFLENDWGQEIPKEVIEAGLMQKRGLLILDDSLIVDLTKCSMCY